LRAAVLFFALCGAAWAKPPEPPPERAARFSVENGRLSLAVDFPELADDALKKRLDSGLATTVVVRAYLVREGSARAEALAVQTVRTAYDLWDEVYVSEVTSESGARVLRDKRRDDALRRISTLQLPLCEVSRLDRSARYRVAVIVELNPVSPALLAQVRKWLSRPREGELASSSGDSYFGSFVSLFVNRRVGEAERLLRFRTQAWAP
jgi:hypothetical protein